MNALPLGIVLGLLTGAASVATMPLEFPDKPAALTAAFISRFMLGLFTATVVWPLHPIATGAIVGLRKDGHSDAEGTFGSALCIGLASDCRGGSSRALRGP